MVRILAVADEVVESLWQPAVRAIAPDLVVACGDLPFDYLEYLVSTLDRPLVFVPGNHDPDLGSVRYGRNGLVMAAGHPAPEIGPAGCLNADGRVLDVAGLRIAGLGGSVRYRPGPNQYTQRQLGRRSKRLARRLHRLQRKDGRGLDLLLTHAPPRHCGDAEDRPHLGIEALHDLLARTSPQLLLHGHIHPYGAPAPDRVLGTTTVVNVVGRKIVSLHAAESVAA